VLTITLSTSRAYAVRMSSLECQLLWKYLAYGDVYSLTKITNSNALSPQLHQMPIRPHSPPTTMTSMSHQQFQPSSGSVLSAPSPNGVAYHVEFDESDEVT
jgi:hypothetical protein